MRTVDVQSGLMAPSATGLRYTLQCSARLLTISVNIRNNVMDWVMRQAVTKANGSGLRWLNDDRLTDLEFADDIALIDASVTQLQQLTDSVESVAREVVLVINTDKTKCMAIGKTYDTIQIKVDNNPLEYMEEFCYLGSVLSKLEVATRKS